MSEEIKKEEVTREEKQEPKAEKHGQAGNKKKRKTDDNEKELQELNQKLEALNDKYLRLYSEFDNYRRRTIKEKADLVKTASEEVITALLPVLDDLERAISAAEARENDTHHLEGLRLIYNKFYSTLQQRGLEPIEAKGQPFDVDFHEAITNIPAPSEEMKGKVVDEVQKGYMLNGKVIRFARVVVGF